MFLTEIQNNVSVNNCSLHEQSHGDVALQKPHFKFISDIPLLVMYVVQWLYFFLKKKKTQTHFHIISILLLQ